MDIRFDGAGFGDDTRKIRWDEILALGIRTTADGPWLEDLFWIFLTRDGPFELPASLVDGSALSALGDALPGLDYGKIASAMGSTDERMWRLWHFEESKSAWDDARFAARFAALVGRLGGAATRTDETFSRLRAAWGDDARRYHDLEHLADCLRELDDAPAAAAVVDVAELALWFHDAVYEPLASDNEARSAAWLVETGAALALPRDVVASAAACVRATTHAAGGRCDLPSAELVVDADLAILGRDPLRFMEFEYAVAEEYAAVAPRRYFSERGRFLAGLSCSPTLYRTAHFRDRYEARARANLAALLASPRYAPRGGLAGLWERFVRTVGWRGGSA